VLGVQAQATRWYGTAFGAHASFELRGDTALAQVALRAATDTLTRLETLFSLYIPESIVSKLNRTGKAKMPPEFAALMKLVDKAHKQTTGLFDPTIQPLWRALAITPDKTIANKLNWVGWEKWCRNGQNISFKQPKMAITLNGIAQGFATDRVREVLNAYGFKDTVVNIGEYYVGETPETIGVSDTAGNFLSTQVIQNGAIATSSPSALMLTKDGGHILHPKKGAVLSRWDTVSVQATTAGFADAYSTALTLAPDTELANRLVRQGLAQRVILKSTSGEIIQI